MNSPPFGSNTSALVEEDGNLKGNLPRATDADGDAFTYWKQTDPHNGTLTVNTDGSYNYRPKKNFNGTDNFQYRIIDEKGAASDYVVSLSISAVNDPPIVANPLPSNLQLEAGTQYVIASDTFADVDSTALDYSVYQISGDFSKNWFTFDSVVRTLSATSNDVGWFEIVVMASDGTLSASQRIEIVVFPSGEVKAGSAYSDRLIGGDGDDTLIGSAGNDTLEGGYGSDQLDGGDGLDIAVYKNAQESFRIYLAGSGTYVVEYDGPVPAVYQPKWFYPMEGRDELASVERLRFSDKSLALDIDGNAGTTAKILGAVFGKTAVANKAYVGIGLHYLDSLGYSYEQLMGLAINAALGPTPTHGQVVDLLYKNVVGVLPDAATKAMFVGMLDRKEQTSGSLGVLAAETDLNKANIDLVGLVKTGLEYLPFQS